ncbi:MAG: ATP-binding cassette domain-containing protein [Actinophytocola sp.]|nr:ATP-binding cassette domain-containing protein [Actinophytocola sp.]
MTVSLTCRGLSRDFGALRAVDDVDLYVGPGSRHALIGPNGAGKSTLMSLVTGALSASSGTVRLGDTDITRVPEARRARLGISQTMQHASLFPSMTVAENVLLAVQRHGRISPLPRRHPEYTARVGELLARTGLDGRDDVGVSGLSHGERKQLELAVALAGDPRLLLLLDEPAAGMSPAESARLVRLIEELPDEVTVLFIEHDLDLVFALATEVTVLHLGRVLLSGTPDEVRASEAVQQAYLGAGRTEELFWSEKAEA